MKKETLDKYINYIGLKCLDSFEDLKELKMNDKFSLIDENNYKYFLSMQNLSILYRRKTIPNKFFNYNKYTKYNINNYFKINNIKLCLITDNPKNATEKLEFKCLIHNKKFNRNWNSVKNGSVYCPQCEIENYRNKRGNPIEYIKEKSKEFNIEIISDVYINNEEKLSFICNKHKDKCVQYKSWGNILTKSCPCIYCSKEKQKEKTTKSHTDFINEVKQIHWDEYTIISEYKGYNNKIKVHCNKCNNDFWTRAGHLLEGHGCGMCTKSKGEENIKLYFDRNNIQYKREYTFNDCIGIKRKLPFDFYLPQYNLCIEFQGVQHYKPIELFGGEKQLKIQQNNDNIKRNYCKENNIKLLEINYKDINNIEIILKNTLMELRKELV